MFFATTANIQLVGQGADDVRIALSVPLERPYGRVMPASVTNWPKHPFAS